MGISEVDASAKAQKISSAQEQPPASCTATAPAAAVYPDWSSFQAYLPVPPHGFFHSPVASSPQAHPYMWGAQHLMPPFGTPPHPYIMYPPGGLYAHPSIPPGTRPFSPYSMASPNGNPEASGAAGGGMEADGKSSEGKERIPLKRSKGSLGTLNMITGKNNVPGKTLGQAANGVFSQSGESGSDSSSEGSDANSQNDSQPKSGGGHAPFDENDKSRNSGCGSQNDTAAPGVSGPLTNLNIGMDYWNASNLPAVTPMRGKIPATAVGGAVAPGAPAELWLQDERELKRQRRKQSNRESARRSRLRKQAECEELSQRADALKEENTSLRTELNRIRTEYEELVSQNTLLKVRLGEGQSGATDLSLEIKEPLYGDKNTKDSVNSGAPEEKSDIIRSGV